MEIPHRQRFFIISDPQIGNPQQEEYMRKKKDKIIETATGDEVLIIPGDLTDHGVASVNNPILNIFCMCSQIRKSNGEDITKYKNELKELHNEYIKPLGNVCKDTLMCIGNHDSQTQWWTGHNPVFSYVKDKHGDLVYVKKINGIMVYCLSKYPTFNNVEWMEKHLKKHTMPFIVFFHYNLEGPFSDWWSEREKLYLIHVIEENKQRFAFIANGHWHISQTKEEKGLLCVNGAGSSPVQVDVELDKNGKLVKVNSIVL